MTQEELETKKSQFAELTSQRKTLLEELLEESAFDWGELNSLLDATEEERGLVQLAVNRLNLKTQGDRDLAPHSYPTEYALNGKTSLN